jgi:hypothetical protein
MAQEQRTASIEGTEGTPAAASEGPGTTASQDDGDDSVVAFDPKGVYQDPNDPKKTVTGDALKRLVNRATMYDQAQSRADKATSQSEKLTAELADTQTQLQDVQKKLAEIEQFEVTKKAIEALGITGKSEKADDDDVFGLTPDEKPEVTREEILHRLHELETKAVATAKDAAESKISEIYANDKAKQQQTERVDRAVARTLEHQRQVLTTRYPDVPSTDIDQIVKLQTAAGALDILSRTAYSESDDPSGDRLFVEATDKRAEAAELEAKLIGEQRRIEAERVRDERLESLTTGGTEFTTEKRTRKMRPAREGEKARRENLEIARKMVAERENISKYV